MDYADSHLLIAQSYQTLLHRFYRSLYIRLDDQVQILHIPRLDLAEQPIQGQLLRLRLLQQLILALIHISLGNLLGVDIVLCRHKDLSGIRNTI